MMSLLENKKQQLVCGFNVLILLSFFCCYSDSFGHHGQSVGLLTLLNMYIERVVMYH